MELFAPAYLPKEKGLLIFDLDGTLADTIDGIRDGVNLAMEKYGFPVRNYGEILAAVGTGARDLVKRSLPAERASDEALVDEVLREYNARYGETYRRCRIYDGMTESLSALAEMGYTLAVLSNKQDVYVKKIVEELFGEIPFAYVAGQTERPKKPDPTVPLWIAESLGFSPAQCSFVGDSEVDVKTALNAGMFALGCSWGYRERTLLIETGAHAVLDHPCELVDCFLKKEF